MKAFILAGTLLLVSAHDASAADKHVNTPANWAGPYIGAYIGWGHSSTKATDVTGEEFGDSTPGASLSMGVDGLVGGGTIGYNFQRGSFVFGPEFDFGFATNEDVRVIHGDDGVYTDYDSFGSLALRAGYSFGRALVYVKGGVAMAKIRSGGGEFDGLGDEDSSGKWGFDGDEAGFGHKTRAGWIIGGGIEQMLANNWSLKAEYTYADFGSKTYTDLENDGADFKFADKMHNVRIGLNYHF